MSPLKHAYRSIRGVALNRWTNKDMVIPNWAVNTILWATIIRSFSYGVELFFIVSNNPIGPLMAFANVFGIQLWGILMLVSITILIIGILCRSTLLISIGSLFCAAVWLFFAFVLVVGVFNLGDGGRFAIAAAATATTWIVFFIIQLSTIKRRGLVRD